MVSLDGVTPVPCYDWPSIYHITLNAGKAQWCKVGDEHSRFIISDYVDQELGVGRRSLTANRPRVKIVSGLLWLL